jgi:hypothetical protein
LHWLVCRDKIVDEHYTGIVVDSADADEFRVPGHGCSHLAVDGYGITERPVLLFRIV